MTFDDFLEMSTVQTRVAAALAVLVLAKRDVKETSRFEKAEHSI